MSETGLYLHIPFCRRRCGYCDFNTYAGLENLIPAYVAALCAEIEFLGATAPQRLFAHTVYFGGGTPSLLSAEAIERLLEALQGAFDLAPGAEISLEANPGTLAPGYLRALHSLGVNRLSLGMQSADPSELRLLDRQHNHMHVIQAVKWARQAGFENLNLDLIFGLPGQSLAAWQNSLLLALGLAPEHFSLYALGIEAGTPLEGWVGRGLLPSPDPDLAAEMYEWASETLEREGYAQYEISNWARHNQNSSLAPTDNPSQACRHNLQYWHNRPYLGLGAGAHGYSAGIRSANIRLPQVYQARLTGPPAERRHVGLDSPRPEQPFPWTPASQELAVIDQTTEMGETMMMGLRLTRQGVSDSAFTRRFGLELRQVYASQIERLEGAGLLEWAGANQDNLRLTPRGRLLGNQVFMEFI